MVRRRVPYETPSIWLPLFGHPLLILLALLMAIDGETMCLGQGKSTCFTINVTVHVFPSEYTCLHMATDGDAKCVNHHQFDNPCLFTLSDLCVRS